MPIVYILTNESMPDIIKIGITDNLSRRLRELDNTSSPLPFECFYALEVDDARGIEKLLHQAFDDKRVRQNREFFNCTPEQAKSALRIGEKMGGIEVTPKEVVFETEQDKQALNNAKKRKGRVDYFGVLGINSGEILTFSKDQSLTCEVGENGQVIFRGEVTTLSRSALIIVSEMGYDWQQINGPGYWCYRGAKLLDLYQQTQGS
ncbi:GIY-YIG nuclease family protein [Planktomarina temperata]|nr:GIY-YIG nuclease family protein [Planktomarina temperata]MDA7440015.1 GIY-YIG nuclease family protein [Planktomarina temperata]